MSRQEKAISAAVPAPTGDATVAVRAPAHPDAGGSRLAHIGALRAGASPRLDGENAEHTRMLADSDAPLPPILVHRPTMRVIDGMHRLRAAQRRGDQTIAVEYFDGADTAAFIMAVRANVTHGLTLTLADRQAAAARILSSHPGYSDKSIAAITGLGARTVAEIRRRDSTGASQPTRRIGRDGRIRPLNGTEARRLAAQAIAERPAASLREIARQVGLSPETVRDVRDRIRRGDEPVPEGRPANRRGTIANTRTPAAAVATQRISTVPGLVEARGLEPSLRVASRQATPDRARLLESLRRDPSLRLTESGRTLLRTLFAGASGPPGLHLLDAMPAHSRYTLAALARACAKEWLALADEMEHRIDIGTGFADNARAS